MKKYMKIALLILLATFGGATMISPIGEALSSNASSVVWKYSLYTRIFGGGYSTSNQVKNCGPLTLAWCLSLFGLILSVILVILYFCHTELSKMTSIILFSTISVFYGVASILYFCAAPIIGNTSDAVIGLGTIFTASFLALGLLVALYCLLKELQDKNKL